MKRIAALAALTITLLAVPTAAMASTTGTGSGHGSPGPVRIACPLPYAFRHGHVKVAISVRAYLKRHRHAKIVRLRIVCPNLPVRPLPKACLPQALKFDMAAGGSTMTEVSGPADLAPPQEFTYDGNTYTIMSVNPGAGTFTVFLNGWRFVNHGAAITDATGYLACTS
jgi:hypothetical protein